MARRSTRNKTKRSVDFSQEVKYFDPDQEVLIEVKSATWEDGNEHPYIALVFKGEDELEDAELYHNASVAPKALRRTRLLLEALGLEIQEGEAMDIDTDELVGLRCMCHTFEDEYTGNDGEKRRTVRADDFWPVDDKKAASGRKGKKDDDDDGKKSSSRSSRKSKDDDEDKLERGDVQDMNRKQLVKLIDQHELDVDADSRKLKKDDDALIEAVIEALEEKDLLAEEKKSSSRRGGKSKDDEDEDKGKGGRSSRGRGGSSKKSKTWSEDDIQDMDEEALDEVVEQAGLDIDLSDHRTLRKKKNALIDALEEADKLDK